MDPHALAEERSRAAHELLAAQLAETPELLARAKTRVASWATDGSVSAFYVEAWREALELPLVELRELLGSASENARALRQASPFAGCLDARTRWRLWREVRARLEEER